MIINGDVNILPRFIQRNIRMLGFFMQLGEIAELAIVSARPHLVIAGDHAIFPAGTHADVIRRGIRGLKMANNLLLLHIPDEDAMGFPAGTVTREQAPIAAIA